ncbi:MAG TPA: hypothetical protein DCK76_07510 [Desulfotomaculum sp.]|nr:MAG: Copper amine oxidase domain protein [Desulfotomaculum sp. 46_296]HAG11213.1 hypothetical protein [Desulfotomaculum sp.]HBY03175.1 hypothetical protein [Desulfotomaculum sp.]
MNSEAIFGYRCPVCNTISSKEANTCTECGHWLFDPDFPCVPVYRDGYLDEIDHVQKKSISKYFIALVAAILCVVMFASLIPVSDDSSVLPIPEVRQSVEPLSFNEKSISKSFTWSYQGVTYSWNIGIPEDLLEYSRNIKDIVQEYYKSDGASQRAMFIRSDTVLRSLISSLRATSNGDLSPWVTEEKNYKFAGYMGEALSDMASKYDYFHRAEFVLSFIGGAIPYKVADVQLPVQTLAENGDCDCKSILLAAILKSMDYKVALVEFPDHFAVGVAFEDDQVPVDREPLYYDYEGTKYYFAETTTAGWRIGDAGSKNRRNAILFPVK